MRLRSTVTSALLRSHMRREKSIGKLAEWNLSVTKENAKTSLKASMPCLITGWSNAHQSKLNVETASNKSWELKWINTTAVPTLRLSLRSRKMKFRHWRRKSQSWSNLKRWNMQFRIHIKLKMTRNAMLTTLWLWKQLPKVGEPPMVFWTGIICSVISVESQSSCKTPTLPAITTVITICAKDVAPRAIA